MTTEPWVPILVAAGAVLLAVAGAAAAAHARRVQKWHLVASASRGAAIVALSVAVVITAATDAGLLFLDPRLVAAALSLCASIIHLVLALAHHRPGGIWAVDGLLAVLLAGLLWVGAPVGATFDCAQRGWPYWVEWTLYLLGSGAVGVAGGVGVAQLATRSRQAELDGDLARFLIPALRLALVTLGGGLLAGTWWAWQTRGTPLASDQRQVWMAVTWLVAGMALVAGQLDETVERWMSGLAVIAALAVTFGLLALPDLIQLAGG